MAYSEEEKDEIVAHVLIQVASGRFVSRVFSEDQTTANGISLPARSTFWKWVFEDSDGEISNKLACAREAGIEALLDEAIDIADETAMDTIKDDNGERPNSEWISRSRLRIDTRIKLAQMMKPKTYGAKFDVTSGGKPISEMDETARAMRLAAVLTALRNDADHSG